MGGEKAGDLGQGGKPGCRRVGFTEQRLSVFAEEEDGRRLAGVIGRLPIPGTGGVGGAERGFHGGAQDRSVDALAALEMWEEMLGGGDDRAGGVGTVARRQLRGLVGRDRRKVVHEGKPRESGNGRAGRRSLSDRTGSNPFRQPSPSQRCGRGRHKKRRPTGWWGAQDMVIISAQTARRARLGRRPRQRPPRRGSQRRLPRQSDQRPAFRR